MQSIVDTSAASKRAASPLFPSESTCANYHQPAPQHGCSDTANYHLYTKRQRTFSSHPYLNTEDTYAPKSTPLSIIWHDFRDQEPKPARVHKPNGGGAELKGPMSTMTAKTASTQYTEFEATGPVHSPKSFHRPHIFFTKASIIMSRGVVNFGRVKVNERSPSNLIPISIAEKLGLVLYLGKTTTIMAGDGPVQSNQYTRFTVQVAGYDTQINADVIPKLQTLLLSRE